LTRPFTTPAAGAPDQVARPPDQTARAPESTVARIARPAAWLAWIGSMTALALAMVLWGSQRFAMLPVRFVENPMVIVGEILFAFACITVGTKGYGEALTRGEAADGLADADPLGDALGETVRLGDGLGEGVRVSSPAWPPRSA